MRFINKKIIVSILIFLEVCSLFLMYKSFNNKNIALDDVLVKENNEVKKKTFAVMVEGDNGDYIEYTSDNSFPESGYIYNEDKSGCMDIKGNKIENALTFNTNNTVTLTTNKTAYCYLYFDTIKPSVTLTVSTDGVNKTLPTYNHYKTTLTCDEGTTASFSAKYQRLEISGVSNTNTKCNLNYTNDTTSYTLLSGEVQNKATQISSVNNNEETDVSYRYTGKQPNNFVWYNNELWRIIGLIPTCTNADCTAKENLVKIIRNEVLGSYIYHSSNANTLWGSGNTLYTLLNSYYYGKLDVTGSSPCFGWYDSYALCNYINKGISSDSNDYYGRMIKSVYMNGGTASDTSTSVDNTYKLETATQTILSKIGLMNASDYGYATSGITYLSVNIDSLYNYEQYNWLCGQHDEWTMTPYSSVTVLDIGNGGFVDYVGAISGSAVRPVIYLESDVYVISGDGTEANPYVLAY